MNEILSVKNLEKSYKKNKVIKGITFGVNRGKITYNGRVIKNSDRDFKQQLGIVPQDIALYEDISAEQNIRFFTSLYGSRGGEVDEKTSEALEFAELTERAKDKVNTFSGGMKRRLNIACSIAHHPEILIMDEPTVGIDPQSRNHILNSVKKMRENGMTIIYTTHYMEEVEEISTRVIIMDKGEIIASGTKEKLKDEIVNYKKFVIEVDALDKVKIEDL